MSYFDLAMDTLAEWEGGWSDHAADPGGLTRFGWTLKTLVAKAIDVNLDGKVDKRDLRDLTPAEARDLYRAHFWDAITGDDLPAPLAILVFNSAVNQGPGRAAKFLQRAVGAKPDGAIGPNTLDAVDRAWIEDDIRVLREFLTNQFLHYTSLAIFATFGRGWTRRTMDFALLAGEVRVTSAADDLVFGDDDFEETLGEIAAPDPHAPPGDLDEYDRPHEPSPLWRRLVAVFGGGD